jgi:hypothetical protein
MLVSVRILVALEEESVQTYQHEKVSISVVQDSMADRTIAT